MKNKVKKKADPFLSKKPTSVFSAKALITKNLKLKASRVLAIALVWKGREKRGQ